MNRYEPNGGLVATDNGRVVFYEDLAPVVEALRDALEYFEDREDIQDGDYGLPRPNPAMVMAAKIRAALALLAKP